METGSLDRCSKNWFLKPYAIHIKISCYCQPEMPNSTCNIWVSNIQPTGCGAISSGLLLLVGLGVTQRQHVEHVGWPCMLFGVCIPTGALEWWSSHLKQHSPRVDTIQPHRVAAPAAGPEPCRTVPRQLWLQGYGGQPPGSVGSKAGLHSPGVARAGLHAALTPDPECGASLWVPSSQWTNPTSLIWAMGFFYTPHLYITSKLLKTSAIFVQIRYRLLQRKQVTCYLSEVSSALI